MTRTGAAARITRIFLLLALFGFDWRGYWVYSREEASGGVGPYLDFVHGVGPAPFQYRVGGVKIAGWLYGHAHVPFRYSFSLFDAIASFIAVMLAYELLRRSDVFRRSAAVVQWFGSAAFVSLVLYALAWQDTYKKNETEPSAALLVGILAFWSARKLQPALVAAGVLLLTLAASLVRADMALCANLGIFALALFMPRAGLALPRRAALAVSGAGALLAVVMQALLIKVIYPHARHYDSAVFMLPHDIGHPLEVAQFLVYIAPTLWLARELRRGRGAADAAGLGLLLGAGPFVLLWMLLGRLEEVRIYLPFAIALTPLAAQALMLRAQEAD